MRIHRVFYTVRQIAAADLPTVRDLDGTTRPATPDELLNMGLHPLGGDLYSCAEQYHADVIDTDTGRERVWFPCDRPPATDAERRTLPRQAEHAAAKFGCGKLLTHGNRARDRYGKLSPAHRQQVLRADVFRATGGPKTAKALVADRLAKRKPAPAADPALRLAELEEARALAADPQSPVERVRVPMAQVDAGDVVEADNVLPHLWAGERL